MHHTPYCYTDYLKNDLIRAFSDKFSLLFLGHEHYESGEIAGISNNSFSVSHAGAFFDKNWIKSEFSIISVNNNFEFEKHNYIWNESAKQYESKGNSIKLLVQGKKSGELIKILPPFLNKIEKDERRIISTSFEEYFVFPRMECIDYDKQVKSKEIKTESIFMSELKSSKLIYISGNHGLGKTTLLKHLFNVLKEEKAPLLLTADDFTNKKPDRVIKNAFEEIYGSNSSDYERYMQMPSNKKVLLIDDIDRIDPNDFSSFILYLGDKFDYIILTSTEKIQFDWRRRLDQNYDYRENFALYKLTPLFKDKRKELVSLLVPMLKTTFSDDEDIINVLCDALDSQKRFVFMSPDFIIQYVDYFCKNVGDISNYDTNVFSKVFEANLTNSLSPHVTGKLNVDKMFVLISKVAYKANSIKEYPIREKTISSAINEYNEDYDNDIKIVDFINICKKAKILTSADNGYRFTSKNYLSYFIAREVLAIYNDTLDTSDIESIINYCCFGINADILLFIIYLSDKLAILDIILQLLHTLVDDWEEYDGKTVTLNYLTKPYKIKSEFIAKNPEVLLEEEVIQEQETDDIRDIQTIDIYDYNEDDVDETINKVVKATSLLNIVARAFPNFEHRIKSDKKNEIVNLLYTVPNKIFYYWAHEIDSDCDGFIKYFLQKNDNEFGLDSAVSQSLTNLWHMSLNLLLDLYYIVVHEGCKSNTYDFLDKYNHEIKYTYQSEYMLMVEHCPRDVNKLITLADKQISTGDPVAKDLSKRILYHAINTMPKLSASQKGKLASRIGLKAETVKKIDVNRYKGAINN